MKPVMLAATPDIHRAAAKIANRIVWMMRQLLRDGERDYAVTQVYLVAREEMEAIMQPKGGG